MGNSLRIKKESEKKPTDTLPEHIGTIFKSKEEIKEEIEMKTFKDFIK
jgi:DNA-directed RNA polymerase subunit L